MTNAPFDAGASLRRFLDTAEQSLALAESDRTIYGAAFHRNMARLAIGGARDVAALLAPLPPEQNGPDHAQAPR